jgi:nitrogen fixation-related uncharacterized protein
VLVYIALTLATGLAGIGIYIYFLKQGQFDDPEDVKYQLFREDEEIKKDNNDA